MFAGLEAFASFSNLVSQAASGDACTKHLSRLGHPFRMMRVVVDGQPGNDFVPSPFLIIRSGSGEPVPGGLRQGADNEKRMRMAERDRDPVNWDG